MGEQWSARLVVSCSLSLRDGWRERRTVLGAGQRRQVGSPLPVMHIEPPTSVHSTNGARERRFRVLSENPNLGTLRAYMH
jgi:hypothetical protein